ncbi:MAG TPA: hypothetical protein PK867_06200 [Pirellulales bacterium]|nr:hypothetical protein [Pirellulales bacterium]
MTDWDMAGNDRYGNCVFAETGNYKKVISPATGGAELIIPGENVIAYARTAGGLNGYNIEDELRLNQTVGLKDFAGVPHTIGGHGAIDWTIREEVKLAIQLMKAIKIGIDHGPLMGTGAGEKNGWVLTGVGRRGGIDHCVGIYGYGSAGYLAQVCKNTLPASLDPMTFCVLLYTWGTIGIVDWPSFVAITGEAWVRVTDPDRDDKATWDLEAARDFQEITGIPPEPGPSPGPTPPTPSPPHRRCQRAAVHIGRALAEFFQ